jgi:hypothetical protein
MRKTISNREKRWRAADALRAITEKVYANDGVTAGQVFRVIRDHNKTILRALEHDRKHAEARPG